MCQGENIIRSQGWEPKIIQINQHFYLCCEGVITV